MFGQLSFEIADDGTIEVTTFASETSYSMSWGKI